jgi:hypothetical protein
MLMRRWRDHGYRGELVEETLRAPQQVVETYGGRKAYQSQIDFGGKRYLIRVIVSATDPVEVVTVYKTSRLQKYWRTP